MSEPEHRVTELEARNERLERALATATETNARLVELLALQLTTRRRRAPAPATPEQVTDTVDHLEDAMAVLVEELEQAEELLETAETYEDFLDALRSGEREWDERHQPPAS